MKTADFIKTYCIGTTCPDFDARHGCRAYDGEECDGTALAEGIAVCEKEENERAKKQRSS